MDMDERRLGLRLTNRGAMSWRTKMRGECVMYRERMYLTRSRYIRGEEGEEEDEGGKKLRLNSRGSRRGNTGGHS